MPSNNQIGSYVVAQLGARMHYGVARILHQAGRLERLLTDACSTRGSLRFLHNWPKTLRPSGLQRWLDRRPKDIPADLIRANNLLGVRYARDFARTRSESERVKLFLKTGTEFGQWAVRQDWGAATSVFVYNTAGIDILEYAKGRGMAGVMEQTIAPYAVERRILTEERRRYPRWEAELTGGTEFEEYAARERQEWATSDLILCGSEFVRAGIIEESGPADRIVVLPYGVDSTFAVPKAEAHTGPLRVLTVGTVGLRKGPMYAVEAAKRLRGKVEFRWVGAFKMDASGHSDLGSDVAFLGPISRSDIRTHYAWADVFFLPSLCEGSATSTYEALTAGRPVVCTPNCGSVVRDGIEGFIAPIRDIDAMMSKLELLASDASLRSSMAEAALLRAREMNYDAYALGLLTALSQVRH